jgi:CCR4-NOT transcription complex subunit 7/8
VSKELGIERVGTMHQAGSDSLVTCNVFFKLKQRLKHAWMIDLGDKTKERFNGLIYGLGDSINEE